MSALLTMLMVISATFLGSGVSQAAEPYLDIEVMVTSTSVTDIAFVAPGTAPLQIGFLTQAGDVAGHIEIIDDNGEVLHSIDFTTGDLPTSFVMPEAGIYQIEIKLGFGEPKTTIEVFIESADPNDETAPLQPSTSTRKKSGPSSTSSPTPFAQSLVGICPDYLFVGARGSGEMSPLQKEPNNAKAKLRDPYSQSEQKNYKAWLGDTEGAVFYSLLASGKFVTPSANSSSKLKTLKWVSVGLEKGLTSYPAVQVHLTYSYLDEISALNTLLVKTSVRPYLQYCPKTKFIFSGYSQGAAIVREALSQVFTQKDPMNTDLRARTIGAILIADPLLSQGDTRLRVSGSSNWMSKSNACGILRFMVARNFQCLSVSEGLALRLFTEVVKIGLAIPCVTSNACSSLNVSSFVLPAPDTPSLSRKLGFPIISVCYASDIVCSPSSVKLPDETARRILRNPMTTHTDTYKESSVSDAIASWILSQIAKSG